MNNPMHTEIFDYYSLTHLSEKDKRSIRKTINKYYKKLYGSKKWNELTDTQRRDFKITTMRSYLLGKILYPDKDKKTRPTTRAKEKVSKIEKKIEADTMLMHKPLIFIEEHNKEMEILKREFFDPSATKEENYKSYLELCDNLAKILPKITPPSFEDWIKKPQRIFDIRESHNWGADFDSACDEIFFVPASKEEIMEEIINCLLKKLNISIDIESIKHCIEVTRNMDCLDYKTMSNSPQEIDMAASLIKLREHDFIKKEG